MSTQDQIVFSVMAAVCCACAFGWWLERRRSERRERAWRNTVGWLAPIVDRNERDGWLPGTPNDKD